MTEQYPEELTIPLGQDSPHLTQLRTTLKPLFSLPGVSAGPGFTAEIAAADQTGTQLFTKIDSLPEDGALFFDAEGPARRQYETDDEPGYLQVCQLDDAVVVVSPFNDMSVTQALTQLEQDLPALATNLTGSYPLTP